MRQPPDITVYASDGSLALVGEVIAAHDKPAEWAAATRQMHLANDLLSNAPFLLIATTDRFFIWTPRSRDSFGAAPDVEVDATDLLRPYFSGSGLDPGRVSPMTLELFVTAWLGSILGNGTADSAARGELQWLFESGLWAAIKGGRLATLGAAA